MDTHAMLSMISIVITLLKPLTHIIRMLNLKTIN